ncbi:glutamine--fructose-6-phosphate transaminase (isomerizing) [Anaerococcus hydrogenalis]|uniref:Glutamine--fructose-6-phosphate aminotransferase [isomerizing] n=1 Tax=Anaerococcus hydrogenalis TaxID=33029 RepID=A0A2N6UGX3_9FIRM|nr:glutamine--fructose-6-phosphate transaminase (isomerizing) [Anaerococcus hydrogenalis]MBS5989343.1 glutamine--fructose-6-phosphate transaminase (isomerizing) [Anaerococcus hydrogenalis]MDK7695782.1 glutamine--fructose-6-phosphate transaminase (isomerizing) [Anaerococcus hydrogenalis]MDK7697545.1 glutamine--fructose-6-phosphate transaminase (isomerizing) [Anaerococcus hydrogenalis]MDK7708809.1 glutamine--fructose-6-phosphate transaminase (isomerizing) [Anaerococcus hydrogenalis]PMC80756.1 gl
MCGIVCYKGNLEARDVIVEGLERLEYRGYDSAGISLIDNGVLSTVKKSGKVKVLKDELSKNPIKGHLGIGHIRWATHGGPSDVNSHPHLSNNGKIAVVHNGIIENYNELKENLKKEGYTFKSETDTEVIAVLIEKFYENDLLDAVRKAKAMLRGSYALGIICQDEDDRLIVLREESPLVLGLTDDGILAASDLPSIIKYTKDVVYLENGDLVDIKGNDYTIYDRDNNKVEREVSKVTFSFEDATKEGYDHFMIKEINEQPKAIADTIKYKLTDGLIDFKENAFSKEEIQGFNKIYMVACGTAYNAGIVGSYAFEKFAKIPVICDIASEFRYNDPFIDDKTLIILPSQSGETADTLAALRLAREKGAKTLVLTNVVASSLDREADKTIYCYAGPEIAVASTKAYTTQIISFYMLALDFARKLETISEEEYKNILDEIKKIPEKVKEILDDIEDIKKYAQEIKNSESIFYLGRGLDYKSVIEGALKLKEVSYIHSEAFAAGELKHGTIALIEEGTPVVTVATQENIMEKTISNVKEVISRGANIFSIARSDDHLEDISHYTYKLPETIDALYPVLAVVPQQLLAYYTSDAKGIDVDKPRNLAKSVTVE